MNVVEHERCEIEAWRPDVRTRMRVAAPTGARQLTVFEQWCDPGNGAPMHLHAVEEVLMVLSGSAEVTVGAETRQIGAGASVIIAAGTRHGFRNCGPETLHVLAILAAPMFEARYDDASEASRRWLPEGP